MNLIRVSSLSSFSSLVGSMVVILALFFRWSRFGGPHFQERTTEPYGREYPQT